MYPPASEFNENFAPGPEFLSTILETKIPKRSHVHIRKSETR